MRLVIATGIGGVVMALAFASASPANVRPVARAFRNPARGVFARQPASSRPRSSASCASSSTGSNAFDSTLELDTNPGNTGYGGISYTFGTNTVAAATNAGAFEGSGNQVCDADAVIAAGQNNAIGLGVAPTAAPYSMIAAGNTNAITALDAFIGAGESNMVLGSDSFVGAGLSNTVDGARSFIGAGSTGTIDGLESFIGAGYENVVDGNGSFIGAGGDVAAAAPNNTIVAEDAFIGAGDQNRVTGNQSFVGSGARNLVSGADAIVLSGFGNIASGQSSVVAGGDASTAAGADSFAAGYHADAAHGGSFVWSDFVSGSATIADTAANQFVARASGGATFISSENMSTGVTIAPGSGTWASLSDRNAKQHVVPIDDNAILAKVAALPIATWRYRSEPAVRHAGPMAQDFYAAFGVGEDDRHIATIDEDGVTLAAVRALRAENAELQARTTALEKRASAARGRGATMGRFATRGRALQACGTTTLGTDAFDSALPIAVVNSSNDYSEFGTQTIAAAAEAGVFEGTGNQVCDTHAAIAGGSGNDIDSGNSTGATNSFIGAGRNNAVRNYGSAIGAGNGNDGAGANSFSGAGDANTVEADHAFEGAGNANAVAATTSFVGAGYGNEVTGKGSFVGAGGYLTSSDPNGKMTGEDSFIGAGDETEVAGNEAFLGAGSLDQETGLYGAVGAGIGNEATGSYAVVLGGGGNEATGILSWAAGYNAKASHNGSFVWSDFSAGSNLIGDSAANQFVVRASGGTTIYSNEAGTAGVTLAPGSGTWSSLSDRYAKTDIVPVDGASILAKVATLPISTWRYTTESGVQHVGPMAQDFYAAFGVGQDDRHVTSIDEDGIALAAIATLHRENVALRARLAALAMVRPRAVTGCGSSGLGSQSFDSSLQFESQANGNNDYASVGDRNVAAGANSGVFEGNGNQACPNDAAIFAGTNNLESSAAYDAFIGAGEANTIESDDSFDGAGNNNVTSSFYAFTGAGVDNVNSGSVAFLGAGTSNVNSAHEGFVGAGSGNVVSGNGSFIGGGGAVTAANPNNDITGEDSFIGAGDENSVTANEAFVGSGAHNVVSSQYGAVLGGYNNSATGQYAVVIGGDGNTAAGTLSFAGGYHADAAHNGSFVWSDYSSGSAVVKDTAVDQFIIRASGGTSIFSNEAATSGVNLAAGSGTWSSLSDRNAKFDVVPIDASSILAAVSRLPVSTWRYKTENGVRHVGPMAQDFYAAFGLGEDDRHVTPIDEAGIALAAIKALATEDGALRTTLHRLEAAGEPHRGY